MRLASGTVVDRYTVLSPIGQGGMATVYQVRHSRLGSLHALKVLTVPSAAVQDRLLQEGRIQSALDHPNIVNVTDVIDIDGSPGLVMEWVQGPTLSELISATRLQLEQVDALGEAILRGVAAAHRAGLVHRDLKPANILVKSTPMGLVPKITDFGLAKVLQTDRTASQTRSGMAMGTPLYMAPEQIRDSSGVDHRADLFSAGVILYQLVTRKRPFDGNDTMEIFQAVTHGRFRPVRELEIDARDRWVEAIEAALTVDVDARVGTAWELLSLWTGEEVQLTDEHPLPGGPWDSALSDNMRSAGSDTFALTAAPTPEQSLAPPETPSPGPPAQAPPARRGRWWVLPVVGMLAAGGLFLAWQQRPPAEPARVQAAAPSEVPVVSKKAAVQTLFQLGWDQWLAADFRASERTFEQVLRQAPDAPMAHFMLTMSAYPQDKVGTALEHIERAHAALTPDTPARDAAIIRGYYRTTFLGGHTTEQLMPVVEAHPDDYLVLLCTASRLTQEGPGWALFDHAIALRPDEPVGYYAKSWIALFTGESQRALAPAEQLVTLRPASPTALEMLGRVHFALGHDKDARDALERSLAADPAQPAARFLLSLVLGLLGDEAARQQHLDALFSAATPIQDRIKFRTRNATYLFGMGRPTAARAELASGCQEARQAGLYNDLITCLTEPLELASLAQDAAGLRAAAAPLRAELVQPEVNQELVRNVTVHLLFYEAQAAHLEGDTETLGRIHTRLSGLRGASVNSSELAQRVAHLQAEQSGDIDAALAHHREVGGCTGAAAVADLLARHRPEQAAAALDEVQSACDRWGADRFLRARAHIVRAELASDPAVARHNLDAFRRLWASPEPDHALVKRAIRLDGRLTPR